MEQIGLLCLILLLVLKVVVSVPNSKDLVMNQASYDFLPDDTLTKVGNTIYLDMPIILEDDVSSNTSLPPKFVLPIIRKKGESYNFEGFAETKVLRKVEKAYVTRDGSLVKVQYNSKRKIVENVDEILKDETPIIATNEGSESEEVEIQTKEKETSKSDQKSNQPKVSNLPTPTKETNNPMSLSSTKHLVYPKEEIERLRGGEPSSSFLYRIDYEEDGPLGITFDLSNPQQEEEGERAIVHIPSPNHLSLSWNLGVREGDEMVGVNGHDVTHKTIKEITRLLGQRDDVERRSVVFKVEGKGNQDQDDDKQKEEEEITDKKKIFSHDNFHLFISKPSFLQGFYPIHLSPWSSLPSPNNNNDQKCIPFSLHFLPNSNSQGCSSISPSSSISHSSSISNSKSIDDENIQEEEQEEMDEMGIYVAYRGVCTFLTKIKNMNQFHTLQKIENEEDKNDQLSDEDDYLNQVSSSGMIIVNTDDSTMSIPLGKGLDSSSLNLLGGMVSLSFGSILEVVALHYQLQIQGYLWFDGMDIGNCKMTTKTTNDDQENLIKLSSSPHYILPPSHSSHSPSSSSSNNNNEISEEGQLLITNSFIQDSIPPISFPFVSSLFGPHPTSNMIYPIVFADETNYGCDQKTYKKKILNKIVILKRGECPFMTKTQVAQELGGLGVIIISNNDIIQPPMKGEEEDDSHISIPTIMISKFHGLMLSDYSKREIEHHFSLIRFLKKDI